MGYDRYGLRRLQHSYFLIYHWYVNATTDVLPSNDVNRGKNVRASLVRQCIRFCRVVRSAQWRNEGSNKIERSEPPGTHQAGAEASHHWVTCAT